MERNFTLITSIPGRKGENIRIYCLKDNGELSIPELKEKISYDLGDKEEIIVLKEIENV